MYIGIDGNEANIEKKVGSNVYAHHILAGLNRYDSKTYYQIFLKSPPLPNLPPASSHWKYRVFGPNPAWTRWRLPLDLFLHSPKPSVFFTPGHYAPAFSPAPKVITIMDLAFLYYPQTYKPTVLAQLKHWTKQSALSAQHILTISQNSKDDIVKHYGTDPANITVTYPGSNLDTTLPISQSEIHTVLKKLSIPQKYLLFIGTNQPRKNLPRLLQAYARLAAEYKHIKLVLVGKTWHQFTASNLVIPPGVIQLDYLSQPDLQAVLAGSLALVFPSLYEGFGLPVLEAMQLGVPVAASNTSSISEITGASPLLFNPTDIDSIYAALNKTIKLTADTKQKLTKQGKITAKQFTWEKCTQKTMEVLHGFTI